MVVTSCPVALVLTSACLVSLQPVQVARIANKSITGAYLMPLPPDF